MKQILVTGGTGYIGSHTVLELLKNDYEVIIVDNLSNSSEKSLQRVQELSGKTVSFQQLDILDQEGMNRLIRLTRQLPLHGGANAPASAGRNTSLIQRYNFS